MSERKYHPGDRYFMVRLAKVSGFGEHRYIFGSVENAKAYAEGILGDVVKGYDYSSAVIETVEDGYVVAEDAVHKVSTGCGA